MSKKSDSNSAKSDSNSAKSDSNHREVVEETRPLAYQYPPLPSDEQWMNSIVKPLSKRVVCQTCHKEGWSRAEQKVGVMNYLCCCYLCLIGCWLCCCIPFCCDKLKTTYHFCESCGAQIIKESPL